MPTGTRRRHTVRMDDAGAASSHCGVHTVELARREEGGVKATGVCQTFCWRRYGRLTVRDTPGWKRRAARAPQGGGGETRTQQDDSVSSRQFNQTHTATLLLHTQHIQSDTRHVQRERQAQVRLQRSDSRPRDGTRRWPKSYGTVRSQYDNENDAPSGAARDPMRDPLIRHNRVTYSKV